MCLIKFGLKHGKISLEGICEYTLTEGLWVSLILETLLKTGHSKIIGGKQLVEKDSQDTKSLLVLECEIGVSWSGFPYFDGEYSEFLVH